MNAFILMIPLLLIRFGLLGMLDKGSTSRAAMFTPMVGHEKTAYYLYQISNILILLFPFFLKVKTETPLFFIAIIVYAIGIVILILSVVSFAKPQNSGINTNGIYNISRNPMYIGYFVYFLGCVILTRSLILLIFLIIFQVSAHWIILSEERWCINKFGEEYTRYMEKVRRYL